MPYRISFSKVRLWHRCRRAWYYAYVMEIQRKLKDMPKAKGTLGHECLEAYYKSGCDFRSILPVLKGFRKDIAKLLEEERVLYESMPEEVFRTLRGYHLYWRDDKNMQVLEHKGKPLVETTLYYPLTQEIELEVVIDLVAEMFTGMWVIDHKWVKSLPQDSYRTMDMQTAGYLQAARDLTGLPLAGAMFNYLRMAAPRLPELLKSGKLSKAKIDTDKPTYLEAIKKHSLNPADYQDILGTLSFKTFFHRYKVPKPDHLVKTLLKEMTEAGKHMLAMQSSPADFFPHNLTRDCDWDCEYRPLCIAELMGHDTKFMLEAQYERRKRPDDKEED